MGMCEKEIFCHVGNSVYLCIPKEKKDGNTPQITMADKFEDKIQKALYQYLLKTNEVDEHLPECPDVETRWESIANSYIPDGAREFRNYPVASLGWMMFIGMAVVKMWDDAWSLYSQIDDLYLYIRDKRGYDALDEYICEDVLSVCGEDYTGLETIVNESASLVHSILMRESIEPGTKEAFYAWVASLHQLYLFGMAIQLKRMGYHMEKL